jgi:L-ribulose-5-phosphate 3-epimerase
MNKKQMTRREMLSRSAGAAGATIAGLTLTAGCQSLSKGTPNSNAGKKGFKIGVCDQTLRKRGDPAALEMAQRIGLDGVQVSMGTAKNDMHLRKPEIQEAYRRASKKYNVQVASLAIGELNKVPYKSDQRADQWVSDSIDVCQKMGMQVVLLPFFGKGDLKNDKQGTDVVIKKLRQVAPKAERAGVFLSIESWLSAEEHMDIIDKVGSPAVKVYYDVANSHKMGYDIYKEIRSLGKHISEFHAKDYKDLYGKGSIDFPKVRLAMDEIGYRGWIHMEGTKFPLGREESCRYDLQYLRGIFPPKV